MGKLIYISHPEVVVDPAKPVPDWGLSPVGAARMLAFSVDPVLDEASSVWSSAERKARDGAVILADSRNLPHFQEAGLGENDRSATGYVAPPRFWDLVDAFFANPDASVEGWEPARDAQHRVMEALRRIAHLAPEGDVAIVAHGGVGALALASLTDMPITRNFDQPSQGNWFSFDRDTFDLLSPWAPLPQANEMEALP